MDLATAITKEEERVDKKIKEIMVLTKESEGKLRETMA